MTPTNPAGYGAEAPVDLTRTAPPTPLAPEATQPVVRGYDSGQLTAPPPPVTADPATWGWRGRLRRATFGLIKPRPGQAEALHRQAEVAIRQHLGGNRLVLVANPKGGAHTTTTALMLAHTFATLRGGGVVAWDNNETRGTLAQRAEVNTPDTHVWNLLGAFERLIGPAGMAGDISHYLRSQPSGAEVLASDTDPVRREQIGAAECGRIALLLSRYFRLAVMDTGANIRASNWQWAAAAAHQLVVPITLEPDVAYTAAWMLDALDTRRPDLVSGAVVVIGPSSGPRSTITREQAVGYFGQRCATVVEVPRDRELAGGTPVVYDRTELNTRHAWVHVAAAVADRLAALRTDRPDQMPAPPMPSTPPARGASVTNLPLRVEEGK